MFAINDDMFGLYARIQTGFSREPHIYKIIARIESNGYCDVPLCTCNTKQTRHGEIVPVLLVIHCGIDESEVIRVKEGDCEIVNSRLSELAEADRDGRCVVLPCKVGDTVYLPAWDCKHGVHWNCENEQHCMTAQACFKCQGKCDLHRAVIEKTVDSDLWLISEVCYGHFGKTVFLTRVAAEAAKEAEVDNY